MVERVKRPLLKLKTPPSRPVAAPAPAPPPAQWRCKPCGTEVVVDPALGEEEAVRCPGCNARLGLARDFRAAPPNLAKLRARLARPG
jgi:hypothetical protein